jgi:signal peptidase II
MRRSSGARARSSSRLTAAALGVATLVVVADQALKWLVRSSEADLPVEFGGGFAVRLVFNSGVSFGRLTDSGDLVLAAVAALAVIVLLALVFGPPRYRLGLGLLLGGALGNLIDRIRFGAVIDFVDVPWWPTFNLADVAIVAGVALVLLQVLRANPE